MAPLHSLSTTRTTPNGNIKAPPDGLPHDLLLIPRLGTFHLRRSGAVRVRTVLQRGGRDRLIELFRGSACDDAGRTRPRACVRAAAGFLSFPAGEGRRWPLIGPLRFFQLAPALFVFLSLPLSLLLQLLVLPPQLLVLLLQPLVLATSSAPLLPKPSNVAFQFFDSSERIEGLRPRHRALSQHSVTDVAEFVQRNLFVRSDVEPYLDAPITVNVRRRSDTVIIDPLCCVMLRQLLRRARRIRRGPLGSWSGRRTLKQPTAPSAIRVTAGRDSHDARTSRPLGVISTDRGRAHRRLRRAGAAARPATQTNPVRSLPD
jgi:hypothetical protein